jgi:anti-sigma factor ChrR (cupin superfamily)
MKPSIHPDDDSLVCHAAGCLPEARSDSIDRHLHHCPRCVRRAGVAECIGGLLLNATTHPHDVDFNQHRCWQAVCTAIEGGAMSAWLRPTGTRS